MRLCYVLLILFLCGTLTPVESPVALISNAVAQDFDSDVRKKRKLKRGLLMIREDEELTLKRVTQKPVEEHLVDLANLYKEALAKEDYKAAHAHIAEMAGYDHVGAMEALAIAYYNGTGVDRNYSKALFWFEKAANMGQPVSLHYLGSMHLNGEGLELDLIQAYKWFSLATHFYPEGPEKERAQQDKENMALRLSDNVKERTDRDVVSWLADFEAKQSEMEK